MDGKSRRLPNSVARRAKSSALVERGAYSNIDFPLLGAKIPEAKRRGLAKAFVTLVLEATR